MHPHFWYAFSLTLIAGLSTGIGSLIAFFVKDRDNTSFLSISMGFAAGVMIYVSFMEIMPHAAHELGDGLAYVGIISFFGGMFLVALIDRIIPHDENPHEFMSEKEREEASKALHQNVLDKKKLMRVGLLTSVALALHNFPEGIATFIATLDNLSTGFVIAVAIALHNIPEGVAVSMPVYYATGSRKKAFIFSFLSGMVEPVGALLAYFIFLPFINDFLVSVLLSAVAGIMVFISLDQLLPSAEKYGKHHYSIYGMVAGMAMMAISLLMLNHAH
jgi:ZIP family zinc transporter